ncbi:MAG: histidine kinase [Sphingomicrobium sp.]
MIALGRLMLATLFLVAIALDVGRPAGPVSAFAVIGIYAAFAVVTLLATWRNWWLDAKLAGPAHAMDIVMFMALVLTTDGSTSPYFTLFIFLMLSAAIRWSWHATALTAMLLILLYLLAGLVVVNSGVPFEPQRFAVRTGHLVILSLILIWFGANQWRTRFRLADAELLDRPSLGESPLETALHAAMKSVGAASGTFVWRAQGQSEFSGVVIRGGQLKQINVSAMALAQALATSPFLYDFTRNRALRKDADRNLLDFTVRDLIASAATPGLDLDEGLAIPVHSDGGQGEIFLEGIHGLSTDHIDLGDQIATAIALHLQRHAMLEAAEGSAEARARLTLARDLHDSVVQFLAGAAFRLEAIKRSHASGREFEPELDELKELMLQEQRELRSIITALRSGPLVAFNDLARDLAGLAERLARQWDIACDVAFKATEIAIPVRLHLDAQQLLREAVANAVRHAEAKTVTVELAATPGELRLDIVNDATSTPARSARLDMPQSLKERVDEAGGTFEMARGMGVTKVSISLPIGGRRR